MQVGALEEAGRAERELAAVRERRLQLVGAEQAVLRDLELDGAGTGDRLARRGDEARHLGDRDPGDALAQRLLHLRLDRALEEGRGGGVARRVRLRREAEDGQPGDREAGQRQRDLHAPARSLLRPCLFPNPCHRQPFLVGPPTDDGRRFSQRRPRGVPGSGVVTISAIGLNAPVPVAIYRGPFGKAQAERLLWRAGFGARPGEAEKLSKLGLKHAVYSMTRPVPYQLVGPEPKDERNRALAPVDAVGHDHLAWLDRMVRTTAPLDRAHDADLARLVRDVEPGRRLAAAHARPGRHVPRQRVRVVQGPGAERDQGSRRCSSG